MTKRTRAQRRWRRRGFTGEVAYWTAQAGRRQPWDFILVLRPQSYAYFRKHRGEDDWIRPISPVFIHNGRKPR